MATKALPTPDVLRQLLTYDPDTGKLFWKEQPLERFSDGVASANAKMVRWNAKYAGQEALKCDNGKGYLVGAIKGKMCTAHRVAWAIYYGVWPTEIDHINGDKSDNRIVNLRNCDRAQNNWNTGGRKIGASGYRGVSQKGNRFCARIKVRGKEIQLGWFGCAKDAARAYDAAARKYHGQYASTNFEGR